MIGNVVGGGSARRNDATMSLIQGKAHDHQPSQNQNNGLMDVDMLDIADLEKERGEFNTNTQAENEEQEELARVRLQR